MEGLPGQLLGASTSFDAVDGRILRGSRTSAPPHPA